MTTGQKYPLSVMRGYKPEKVRYVWYIKAVDGDGKETNHCGLTHGGITNLTTRGKKSILKLKVADLARNAVYEIKDVEAFMQAWGENYFDFTWRVPQTMRKKDKV